jgi:hypothetical protein
MIASPLAQHQAVRRHHCLVHACVNGEQVPHEWQLENPPGFLPRPGEHQVPASFQGLSPCPDQDLCVPKTGSGSCDQAIFVDQATDAGLSSDPVLLKIDRFG